MAVIIQLPSLNLEVGDSLNFVKLIIGTYYPYALNQGNVIMNYYTTTAGYSTSTKVHEFIKCFYSDKQASTPKKVYNFGDSLLSLQSRLLKNPYLFSPTNKIKLLYGDLYPKEGPFALGWLVNGSYLRGLPLLDKKLTFYKESYEAFGITTSETTTHDSNFGGRFYPPETCQQYFDRIKFSHSNISSGWTFIENHSYIGSLKINNLLVAKFLSGTPFFSFETLYNAFTLLILSAIENSTMVLNNNLIQDFMTYLRANYDPCGLNIANPLVAINNYTDSVAFDFVEYYQIIPNVFGTRHVYGQYVFSYYTYIESV
jgi:hypothetical protein